MAQYKCNSCYTNFDNYKENLGKAGCPGCGSHNFILIDGQIREAMKQEMNSVCVARFNHECPYCQHINPLEAITDIYKCSNCSIIVDIKDFSSRSMNDPIRFTDPKQSKFEKIGTDIGKLLNRKNKDYGNAFVDVQQFMLLMFPNGIPIEKYIHALAITRIFDKMKRIVNVKNEEDIENPYEDIAGYAILMSSVWRKK